MRFAADFQSMDGHDALTITFGDLLDAPAAGVLVGSRVTLDDLEGNQADATVVDVSDGLIDVQVDVATWRSNLARWVSVWSPQESPTGWAPAVV